MEISGTHNLQVLRGLSSNKCLLSCAENCSFVDMYYRNDGSGRQDWEFIPVSKVRNLYHIKINRGVTGDKKFLSVLQDGSRVDLWDKDDGSGRQVWEVVPVEDSPTCNTYHIIISTGVSSSKCYLSCTADGNEVDLWEKDDGSGRQRWQIQGVWKA